MMDRDIRDDLGIIQKTVSQTDKVLQLAEETAELSAAASKFARILNGTNPTPMSSVTAWYHMLEEIGDVLVCLLALKYTSSDITLTDLIDHNIVEFIVKKTRRWARRIKDMKGGGMNMSYQSPIEIIYGNLKLETENAIVRAVQQVGINVDKEELRKALVYDRHMYERGRRDRDSEIVRCKDCKYGEKTKNTFREDLVACRNYEYIRLPDWFCADAVHKEKENEK